MIERLEVKMSEGDGGEKKWDKRQRGRESPDALFSSYTDSRSSALWGITITHAQTHTRTHERPRRQNEGTVWALKPQTKHWEHTHMLPLTQRYTHARPHKHKAKHAYLLIRFHGKHELTADVLAYHDFLILVVSILPSPPDQIPLAYRKGNNSWCWCIIRACYVYVYRGRHWDLCFQEESNSRWCHSIAGMMTPESWRADPRVG